MKAINLQEHMTETDYSKTDLTGISNDQHATTSGARPKRVGCHSKPAEACKPTRGRRRTLPYEEIRRLHGEGLTGLAIAKQLGLTSTGVHKALSKMGLGTGRHNQKRVVLPNGKICCSICHREKKASEFRNHYSYCKFCSYSEMARQSNNDPTKAIHIRSVWIRGRAKRLRIGFDLTGQQLAHLYVIQCGQCAYCKKPMVLKLGVGRSEHSASIERIIPHKQGGTYTLKNVVWVHFRCNCRRNALTGKEAEAKVPTSQQSN